MSQCQPNRATPMLAGAALPSRPAAPATRAPILTPHTVGALAAARNALEQIPFSLDALRAAVVRYAGVAREAGASAAEVTEALEAEFSPTLARFTGATAAELRVHVAWWAAHGYHRAD